MTTEFRDPLAAFADGDTRAFDALYHCYGPLVYRYALGFTGNEDTSADITQDTFLRIARSPEKFRGVENTRVYLLRCARNEALMRLRRTQVSPSHKLLLRDRATLEAPGPEQRERATRIQAALLRLPLEQREIVHMHLMEDLTFREAAEITGQPANTLASRYRLALEKLREYLRDYE